MGSVIFLKHIKWGVQRAISVVKVSNYLGLETSGLSSLGLGTSRPSPRPDQTTLVHTCDATILILIVLLRAKLSTGKALNQHCLTQALFVQKKYTQGRKNSGFSKNSGIFCENSGSNWFFRRKNAEKSKKFEINR